VRGGKGRVWGLVGRHVSHHALYYKVVVKSAFLGVDLLVPIYVRPSRLFNSAQRVTVRPAYRAARSSPLLFLADAHVLSCRYVTLELGLAQVRFAQVRTPRQAKWWRVY